MLSTIETREQKFFKEFSQWSGLYVEALKSSDIKDFSEFNATLLDSTALFGLTEFYGRQLERTKIFKVTPQRIPFLEERVRNYNKNGLTQLDVAISLLPSGELLSNPLPMKDVKDIIDEIKFEVAEYDFNKKDAETLNSIIDEVLDVAQRNGEKGLIKYIGDKLNELKKLRNTSDRGTSTNLPLWKIAIWAAYIGIGVYIIYQCIVKQKAWACEIIKKRLGLAGGLYGIIATIIAIILAFAGY